MSRGGIRPGSGRPKVQELRKPRVWRLTEAEFKTVGEFVKKMKEAGKMIKVRVCLGDKEEIYEVSDFAEATDKFCIDHDVSDATEMTVTEVGSFYDKNR